LLKCVIGLTIYEDRTQNYDPEVHAEWSTSRTPCSLSYRFTAGCRLQHSNTPL